ncbi:MAG: Hsp20/alpha crystallin family protein [Candidatus Hydrothermarchaeota archaeon]|nr:Hsp20/alpha crystallin family protein [Candidatus Hydrothermarchaeota archaeon]
MRFDEFEEMDEIFERMFRTLKSGKIGEPLYCGFSTGVLLAGATAKPVHGTSALANAREPFTDVIVDEKNSEVIVTAEMPGVAKEDIRINAAKDSIEIRAETKDKRYHKNLPLDVEIDPNSTDAKYNNGILEIKAKLQKPTLRGVNIKIE